MKKYRKLKRRPRVETTPAVTVAEGMSEAVTLHYADGKPLQAGDLREGETVTFDRVTGEVLAIEGKKP